jgi:hypothetical protein
MLIRPAPLSHDTNSPMPGRTKKMPRSVRGYPDVERRDSRYLHQVEESLMKQKSLL